MKNTKKVLSFLMYCVIFVMVNANIVMATENDKMPQINQAIEVDNDIINNAAGYREGWYKSWGGEYELVKDKVCTTYFIKVPQDSYYIYINDSRIKLAISEYDSDGSWLKITGGVKDGSLFVKQQKTEYITYTVSSSVWGVNIIDLFQNGLKIEFSQETKDVFTNVESISIANANFINANNWIAGEYSSQTGAFAINPNKACYKSYCVIEEEITYLVSLPSANLKMNIIELDLNNSIIVNQNLYNGQKWKKNAETKYVAFTISGINMTFTQDEYKFLIESGEKIGIYPYVPYQVSGEIADLSASEFVHRMNVGWNLGNSLDSKATLTSRGNDTNLNQEMYWGNPYVSKDLIDYVASCGFNTIRIPVTWYYNSYVDENGNLRIGRAWLARVKEVVDYAMANDMYVILNSHHEQPILYAGVSDEEMVQVLNNACSLWKDIAEYFMDYNEHLIFESYNEIDNMALSWNYSDLAAIQMNQMNQTFVDTVRATGGNNATRILMVPTLLDGVKSNILNAFVLPSDTVNDRLIVQVHLYSQKFHQVLEDDMEKLEKFSNKIGAPVVIGECGTTKSYVIPEARKAHATNYISRAAKHGIKCIWWDDGASYAIIDRRNLYNSNYEIINALMEGTKGIGYEVKDEIVINNISQVSLKMPNLQNGILEDKYWGTIVTDISGNGINVAGKKNCIISLNAINEATDIWLQRVLYYDELGNYIGGKELQLNTYICKIPEGTAYIRVSMNSPTRSIKYDQYSEYLLKEKFKLSICLFNEEDIKQIDLNNN